MTTSERHVTGVLDTVRLRMRIAHALLAGSAAGATAAIVSSIAWWNSMPASRAGALSGAAVWGLLYARRRGDRTRAAAARRIEQRAAAFRNVLITAAELLAHPSRAAEWVRARVMDDAAGLLRAHSGSARVELGRPAALFTAAQLAWFASVAGLPHVPRSMLEGDGSALVSLIASRPAATAVRVVVEPPTYTGVASTSAVNPERVDAVEGSRLRIVVANGTWSVRVGRTILESGSPQNGATVFETTVKESGLIAIEANDGNTRRATRLIALSVGPDRTPAIRVEQPGRDLLLPSPSSIDVRATATDDYGLQALELRYTKVSGSGEQFEFVEGTLPVEVRRGSAQSWAAAGRVDLGALGLERGDSLVYRVVARDGRPGEHGVGTSDTYFVEIAGPGQVVLAGIDLPPEQDRYAFSQQMIVLKIERLRARASGLDRGTLREAAHTIAAEQRAVRANFIFLMGGHVEDEEVEAEQSHEIAEGRLENPARRDIAAAVRHMTAAERGLSAVDTGAALVSARAAVAALQRAFGHSRYILRTAPVRSRIDMSRRLSRAAEAAGGQMHRAASPQERSSGRARQMLASLLSIQPDAPTAAGPLARITEEALSVTPASMEWQEIARALVSLRDVVRSGGPAAERRRHLDAVVAALNREARRDALVQPAAAGRPTRLSSAWAEGSRR